MKASIFVALTSAALAAAQGVTGKIAPKASAPDGCKPAFNGLFQVTVETVTTVKGKRDLTRLNKRDGCAADGTLVVGLAGGVLTDAKARTGYIASNYQFQFDGPPQAGAIYTAGFSVCGNNSVALGGSTVFYECASGDFYNLYDRNWAPQCSAVEIVAMPCGGPDPPFASQIPDGQVIGTTVVATTVVVPLSDGQPQVITTQVPVPICQIGDGQIQGKTTPCASIKSTSAKPTSAPAPVSQYSDGQIQVTPVGSAPHASPPPATATATPAAPAPTGKPSSGGSAPAGSAPAGSPSSNSSSSAAVVKSTLSSTTSPSSTASKPSASPSAPVSGAGNLEMSSIAALVIGIVGALWIL